jgi:putative SOS response-associated peptidase YedK
LRYNIAPSQQVPVIVRNEERNILKPMRWGLVPSWTDDKAIWQRLINARAETLRERPSYKRLVSTQRCLIPADGFYECKRQRNQEVPMWICRRYIFS